MNCDQVFDVLTRGPFPTGHESDASVERHLACCHECRELADALQPAVNLFHEALAADEPNLPGYRGVHSAGNVACLSPALRAAIEEDMLPTSAARPTVTRRDKAPFDAWRVAGVLSLGPVLAGLILAALWIAPHVWPESPLAGNARRETNRRGEFQPNESGRAWLASLGLKPVCYSHGPELALAHLAESRAAASELEARHDCCLKCHAASNPSRPPPNATASLDRSCHACHSY